MAKIATGLAVTYCGSLSHSFKHEQIPFPWFLITTPSLGQGLRQQVHVVIAADAYEEYEESSYDGDDIGKKNTIVFSPEVVSITVLDVNGVPVTAVEMLAGKKWIASMKPWSVDVRAINTAYSSLPESKILTQKKYENVITVHFLTERYIPQYIDTNFNVYWLDAAKSNFPSKILQNLYANKEPFIRDLSQASMKEVFTGKGTHLFSQLLFIFAISILTVNISSSGKDQTIHSLLSAMNWICLFARVVKVEKLKDKGDWGLAYLKIPSIEREKFFDGKCMVSCF